MNKALKELTNIGVPVYNPIELSVASMTISCGDDIPKTIGKEREIRQEVINRVEKLTDHVSTNYKRDYLANINFYANDNSTSVFDLTNQQKVINIFGNLVERENLLGDSLSDTLNKLRNSRIDLAKKIDFIVNNTYTKQMYSDLRVNHPMLYGGKGYDDLREYLLHEDNFFTLLEDKLDDIYIIDNSDLLDDYVDLLIPEKVALLLSYTYLNDIYLCIKSNETSKMQEKLFYVTAFLKNKIDRDITISVNGIPVNYDYIKNIYNDLLTKYSFLHEIKMKRSLFEGKDLEINKQVIDRLINMDRIKVKGMFLRPGQKNIAEDSKLKTRQKRILVSQDVVDEYLEERYYEYLRHNPIAQITCTSEFSNYVGFLYENGIIPADRLLNVTPSNLNQDAIYIFDSVNFDKQIKMDKQTLRKTSVIKPLNHSGQWEERLESIIYQPTCDKMKEKAKELVKQKNKIF